MRMFRSIIPILLTFLLCAIAIPRPVMAVPNDNVLTRMHATLVTSHRTTEMTTMATMRAKMQVTAVEKRGALQEDIHMSAVTGNASFGTAGENEDNTYARYTPSGRLSLSITNPALINKFKVGDKFYIDFTEAE